MQVKNKPMQTKAEKQFQENCWQLCSKELSNFSFHSFVLLAFFSQNSYHRYQTFQTQHFEHRHFVPNEIKLFQQNNGLCAEYNPNILRGLGGGGGGGWGEGRWPNPSVSYNYLC